MTREQLETGLDRYGGDLERWPAAERRAAEMLIAGNAEAAAVAKTARRLEARLAEMMRPMAIDSAFAGRIASGLQAGVRQSDAPVRPTSRLIAWAGAAAMAFLVTGYAVGLALPTTTTSQSEDAFAGLLFGNSAAADSATAGSGGVL